tara:strand:- start:972 stop:1145 length:174 start_codon:yes stop_codon:yes gene_type:complete
MLRKNQVQTQVEQIQVGITRLKEDLTRGQVNMDDAVQRMEYIEKQIDQVLNLVELED